MNNQKLNTFHKTTRVKEQDWKLTCMNVFPSQWASAFNQWLLAPGKRSSLTGMPDFPLPSTPPSGSSQHCTLTERGWETGRERERGGVERLAPPRMTSAPYRSSRQTQLHISTEGWPRTDFHAQPTDARLCVGAPVNTSALQQRTCFLSDRSFSSDLRWKQRIGLLFFFSPPLLWTPFSEDTCYLAYWGVKYRGKCAFCWRGECALFKSFSGSFSSCKGNPKSYGIMRGCWCQMHLPAPPPLFFKNHIYCPKRRVP